MTAKERRYVRKLEIENEELKRHLKIANESGAETFLALYETRVAMRQAYEALVEAANALEDNMRDDPAFMEQQARMREESK